MRGLIPAQYEHAPGCECALCYASATLNEWRFDASAALQDKGNDNG